METNTNTLTAETSTTPAREPLRRPKARRGVLTWAAVVGGCIAVAAFAVATLTGGGDDSDIPTPRLDPRAEQYERQAHLDGQARTYDRDTGAVAPSEAGNQSARRGEAEHYERQAHLDGQAKTHSSSSAAGNRAALEAQADAYVDSLQARAEDSGSDDEFVPGSRHMPTR